MFKQRIASVGEGLAIIYILSSIESEKIMENELLVYKSIMDWLNTKTCVRICFDKDIDYISGRDYLEVTMDIRHSQRSNKNEYVNRQFIVKRSVNLSYSDKAVADILDEMYQDGLSMMEQCR